MKSNKRHFNYLYLFSTDEVFLFLLIMPHLFATGDVANVSAVYDPEINFTAYNDTSNETSEDLSIILSNMTDSFFNLSANNLSVDVATELESSISVTEDSDNFQSKINKDLFIFLTPDEDICNCDLSSYVCDINCCCDPDCSQEDIQVFSECSHQVLTPDENYCYRKDIILRNSTVYKMVRDPKNAMFCIVHDNLKHHLRFKDMPVLKSHRDVVSVLKYKFKSTYSWDLDTETVYESSEWKAGKPIYVQVTSNQKVTNHHWSLPTSCLSDVCTCKEEVRYLDSFRSSCSHFIKNLELECEHSEILSGKKFANFCTSQQGATSLANLVIHTKQVATNVSDDVEYDISLASRVCTQVTQLKKPMKSGNFCENVVRHIQFTVEHDGVNGIVGIKVDFKPQNVPLDQTLFAQSYSVDYVWTNATSFETKSGNPGYQIGLPILAATNGSDFNSEDLSRASYKEGLSVLSSDGGSLCDNSQHRVVKFGKNLKTGCRLEQNFADCDDLRNKVSDVLLGPNRQQIYVGIFGNANLSNPNDWIEVFSYAETPAEDGSCLVSLGLKIHIIYAAVGTVANPQYKIVGVRYSRMKHEAVDLNNGGSVTLSTSVSFFDVTLSAIEHYAKVPSIKANLPDDFFYPFLYGQSANSKSNVYFILILFFICHYFWTACVIK